ncbi:MAG: SGNH/GDSL hydrolase family protein [Clostridia bacterium]|nr:SGNH/GDSL hydrolase family protein [Clostridia bacterium]
MAKKLTILGDSIMKGVMYNKERNRYVLYNDGWFLDGALERGVEIEKRCRMGATVEYGFDSLSAIPRGSSVLIEFGGNDSNFNWSLIADSPKAEHRAFTPPEDFYERYKKLVRGVMDRGAEPIAMNLIPIDAGSYFKWISRTANGERVLEWLGDENMLYRWHEYYSRVIERVAGEMGCRLVDLRGQLLLDRSYCSMIGADGLHPNEKGHELIRKLLLPAIV